MIDTFIAQLEQDRACIQTAIDALTKGFGKDPSEGPELKKDGTPYKMSDETRRAMRRGWMKRKEKSANGHRN